MANDLTEKERRFCEAAKAAFSAGTARMLVLSRPGDPSLLKWKLERRSDGKKILFVAETFLADGKDLQKNHPAFPEEALAEMLPRFFQGDLIGVRASAEYKRSKKGSEFLRLPAALTAPEGETAAIPSLAREKNRLLDGSEPFLRELGVADPGDGSCPPGRRNSGRSAASSNFYATRSPLCRRRGASPSMISAAASAISPLPSTPISPARSGAKSRCCASTGSGI